MLPTYYESPRELLPVVEASLADVPVPTRLLRMHYACLQYERLLDESAESLG